MGGGTDGTGARRHHPDDHRGQHPGDPERVHAQATAHRAELLHRVTGGGRHDGGGTGAATERGLLAARPLALQHHGLQDVADERRPLLHSIHPQPVRHRPGSILGNHRSHQLRSEAYAQTRLVMDCQRVDRLAGHQLTPTLRLEQLARRVQLHHSLPADVRKGLHHLLFTGFFLHSAVHHDAGLRQDLHRHQAAPARSCQGHQAQCRADSATGASERRRISQQRDQPQRKQSPRAQAQEA